MPESLNLSPGPLPVAIFRHFEACVRLCEDSRLRVAIANVLQDIFCCFDTVVLRLLKNGNAAEVRVCEDKPSTSAFQP